VNIHHLELFYHVAKHGGISAAVRRIPYGIQQPAVSGQMGKLEEEAGAKLFERTPFRLTAAGAQLFAHVQPFFEGLDAMADRVREASAPRLRVGAAELVIRDHLHPVLKGLRARDPRIKFGLRSGFAHELEGWLHAREIDVMIAPLEGRVPARLSHARLMQVPLVLLAPRDSELKSAADLWARGEVVEPLVTLPATEPTTKLFRRGLKRVGVKWPLAIETSSLELVARYVERGYGLGVSVALPEVVKDAGVRALPLEGFDSLEVAIFWLGEATPLIQLVLDKARGYVREMWPEWAVGDSKGKSTGAKSRR
jgi:DNA-binding transcriptional LysR family regulator